LEKKVTYVEQKNEVKSGKIKAGGHGAGKKPLGGGHTGLTVGKHSRKKGLDQQRVTEGGGGGGDGQKPHLARGHTDGRTLGVKDNKKKITKEKTNPRVAKGGG